MLLYRASPGGSREMPWFPQSWCSAHPLHGCSNPTPTQNPLLRTKIESPPGGKGDPPGQHQCSEGKVCRHCSLATGPKCRDSWQVLKSEEVLELGSTFDEAALALVDTAQGRSQRSPESRVSVGTHLLGPGSPHTPGAGTLCCFIWWFLCSIPVWCNTGSGNPVGFSAQY